MSSQASRDAEFLRRVGSGLLRLLALLLFIGAHWVVSRALVWSVPSNLGGGMVFVSDIVFGFFVLIYAYLGWEMLAVFVPWLRRSEYRGQAKQDVTEEIKE
jgi:hypothetical protein